MMSGTAAKAATGSESHWYVTYVTAVVPGRSYPAAWLLKLRSAPSSCSVFGTRLTFHPQERWRL